MAIALLPSYTPGFAKRFLKFPNDWEFCFQARGFRMARSVR
jgi:hypothetical protein